MKNRPRICASIVSDDLAAIKGIAPFVELFEVRIDLIGEDWPELVRRLDKPWIACNRTASEGGRWSGSESARIEKLLDAIDLGAAIIDIELVTDNLESMVKRIKTKAECLLSFHDQKGTPSLERMKEIVNRQLVAGADICKMVTTAQKFEDNLTVLQLIPDFSKVRIVAFAMGSLGFVSRMFCPLAGGDFVYAAVEKGQEAASGQITVGELRKIYGMMPW
ncbi:MAG: type I 3-dehydroquinate dehydratase [Dehalococcoidales bacterium]|nr:type I 3-dehydroquinate dehydratase [Dehalococcoidales bacterium]MDP7415709.1 type I 3-dehydroquinate dehydratase [Dehalococcoidales bacterium]